MTGPTKYPLKIHQFMLWGISGIHARTWRPSVRVSFAYRGVKALRVPLHLMVLEFVRCSLRKEERERKRGRERREREREKEGGRLHIRQEVLPSRNSSSLRIRTSFPAGSPSLPPTRKLLLILKMLLFLPGNTSSLSTRVVRVSVCISRLCACLLFV